jgi:hypothetical protein
MMGYYIILCWNDSRGDYFVSELAFPTRGSAESHAQELLTTNDVSRTEIFRVLPLRGE